MVARNKAFVEAATRVIRATITISVRSVTTRASMKRRTPFKRSNVSARQPSSLHLVRSPTRTACIAVASQELVLAVLVANIPLKVCAKLCMWTKLVITVRLVGSRDRDTTVKYAGIYLYARNVTTKADMRRLMILQKSLESVPGQFHWNHAQHLQPRSIALTVMAAPVHVSAHTGASGRPRVNALWYTMVRFAMVVGASEFKVLRTIAKIALWTFVKHATVERTATRRIPSSSLPGLVQSVYIWPPRKPPQAQRTPVIHNQARLLLRQLLKQRGQQSP